nr:cytochrome d ubiquinol oxidase subunit II [Anaerolineae bacterium]
YTLRIMTIVALIFVPIVLAYQAWNYYVFRHRVTGKGKLTY